MSDPNRRSDSIGPIDPDARRGRRGLGGGARIVIAAGVIAVLAAGAWAVFAPGGLPWPGRVDPAAFGPAVADAHAECYRPWRRERRACYGRALTRLVAEDGPEAALAALEGLAAVDRSVERDAHHHAHHIGIEAYRHGSHLTDVFPRCTEAFSSGCYHGVIQAHFIASGRVDERVLRETCEPYRGAGGDPWLHFQCLHGLGHGLVLHEAGDLFEALGSCDALETHYQRESCYGGAFMENIVSTPHAHGLAAGDHHEAHADRAREPVPPALDPDDPLYPCTVLERRYLRACYGMQSSAILRMSGGDLGAVARACAEAPPEGRDACFQGLARDVAGRARFDPERAHHSCTRLQEEGETWCYIGVARNMVNFDARPELAFRFCRHIEEPQGRSTCFRTTGSMLRLVTRDTGGRTRLCEGAGEPADVRACLRGAGAPTSDDADDPAGAAASTNRR